MMAKKGREWIVLWQQLYYQDFNGPLLIGDKLKMPLEDSRGIFIWDKKWALE